MRHVGLQPFLKTVPIGLGVRSQELLERHYTTGISECVVDLLNLTVPGFKNFPLFDDVSFHQLDKDRCTGFTGQFTNLVKPCSGSDWYIEIG